MGWLQRICFLLERPTSAFHGLSLATVRQVPMARVCRVGLHRAVTFHCGTDCFLRWLDPSREIFLLGSPCCLHCFHRRFHLHRRVCLQFRIPKIPMLPYHLFANFKIFTVHMIIFFITGMIWQAVATLAPQATLYMYTNKPVQIRITQIPCNLSGSLEAVSFPLLSTKSNTSDIKSCLPLSSKQSSPPATPP